MSESLRVSGRYRISLPRIACERLGIKPGDRLLADVQDGLLILIPKPQDCAARLVGLHREVWTGLDTTVYLAEEREAWNEGRDRLPSG